MTEVLNFYFNFYVSHMVYLTLFVACGLKLIREAKVPLSGFAQKPKIVFLWKWNEGFVTLLWLSLERNKEHLAEALSINVCRVVCVFDSDFQNLWRKRIPQLLPSRREPLAMKSFVLSHWSDQMGNRSGSVKMFGGQVGGGCCLPRNMWSDDWLFEVS